MMTITDDDLNEVNMFSNGDLEQISEHEEKHDNLFDESDIINTKDAKEGIFYDMLNSDYHEADGISSTQFKDLDLSVAVFDNRRYFQTTKGCFNIGDCNHVFLLEPHKKHIFIESTTATFDTKATKQMIGDNPDNVIVPQGTLEVADERAKKVKLIFGKYLNSSKMEVSILVYCEETQMYHKCRTDIWMQEQGIILDYKTSKEDTPVGFINTIEKYDYDLSAAWYIDTVNMAIEKFKLPFPKVTQFGWIVSPNIAPHKPYGVFCSDELAENGRAKYANLLDKLMSVRRGEEENLFKTAFSREYINDLNKDF